MSNIVPSLKDILLTKELWSPNSAFVNVIAAYVV